MNSSLLRLGYRRGLWTALMVAMLAAMTVSAPVAAREPQRPDLAGRGTGQELEWKPTRTSNANTIDVVSANAFLYLDGTVAVVGDVLSTMTSRREGVSVNVDFYNGDDHIGSLGGPIFLTQLAYGSTSPFVVYDVAPEGTEAGVTTFQVMVDFTGTRSPHRPEARFGSFPARRPSSVTSATSREPSITSAHTRSGSRTPPSPPTTAAVTSSTRPTT